jgi:hypothetical protein
VTTNEADVQAAGLDDAVERCDAVLGALTDLGEDGIGLKVYGAHPTAGAAMDIVRTLRGLFADARMELRP